MRCMGVRQYVSLMIENGTPFDPANLPIRVMDTRKGRKVLRPATMAELRARMLTVAQIGAHLCGIRFSQLRLAGNRIAAASRKCNRL